MNSVRIANAPCSWGALEFDLPGPFLVLADDNGKDPTRTALAGRIRPAHSLGPEQWRLYGERVNQVADRVRRRSGLRSVFHHHCAGFVEAPSEIEALMLHTDPKLVGLCFDTGHYRFGGGTEPIRLLQKFRERIWHVHFKDCSATVMEQSREQEWDYFDSLKHGIFCELGKGDVPFSAIIRELAGTDYKGWVVVEQDILPGIGTPKTYAARNRAFLQQHGLG